LTGIRDHAFFCHGFESIARKRGDHSQ
jgi:hypothetical protein